uniref:Kinesin-like protein n=1 Tax=Kalanchoe fedtschenkoi TaxID=63787 RepID=A0A7N0TJ06_KALFE
MSTMGRQIQRSGAHHQRQYSDHFLDSGNGSNRWLQSAGLHHLQQQDFGFCGGGVGNGGGGGPGSRAFRLQRGFSGESGLYSEPSSPPPMNSRFTGQQEIGKEAMSPGDLSPGLLDLHSLDTELIPEIPTHRLYGASSMYHSAQGRNFDDTDTFLSTVKPSGRAQGGSENDLLKTLAVEKEKANPVAKIRVVVRKRPLNKKELSKNEEDIIDTQSNFLTVHETKFKVDLTEYEEKHEFMFDAVLNEEVSNDEVYRETVEPIVPTIFQRTKATCFAYGQTGSGKTYTMKPLPLKASRDILRLMHHTYRAQGFQLFVSFFEIYGGKLYDLLNERKKLFIREDGKQQVCIVGLQEHKVSDVEAIKDLIERGNATRSTGTTGANEESSRSHAILQLAIKRSVDGNDSKPPRVVGKLSFIDLAGSERGADTTDNDKQTRMEGAEINKSLLALKECIRALDNDQGHIPFRGSKLTEVLRDSFVGNSRTVMISCISPSSGSCEHTINTLRYADRVKSLSKGNGSRREVTQMNTSLRESTTFLSSSAVPVPSPYDVDELPKQTEGNEIDLVEEQYESDNSQLKYNQRLGSYHAPAAPAPENVMRRANGLTQVKESKSEPQTSQSDDDLNFLLQEEEDLINAHRSLVEETMNMVREEMNLLVEADHPGNQLDDYVTRLNAILSQKAAGVLRLQTRLENFHRLLKEHNVLVSYTN